MKLLFILGDDGKNSPERKLAAEAEKLIGRDAEVLFFGGKFPSSFDGVWIFTHEEDGGCPEALMALLEENFARLKAIPALATGIGGKEGGMNAVDEIAEFFRARDGRFMEEGEPLCVPMRSTRFELGAEERMELFFLVDAFIKYCGMDESESRKIAFETVVKDYFRLMKYLARSEHTPTVRAIEGNTVKTDLGDFDCVLPQDAPADLRELRFEIESLVEDYEIGTEEILPALSEKLKRDW